ncbi:DUF2971 domain-containing protein [Acinetobacter soli]|uniref:DUF2971 domain-containing protein n=1 Tax=Acinetobacter soli TaxID=487316 RepID=UPI003F87999A
MDKEHKTLGVFHNCELKYQYPLYFNDPYDCLCSIELSFENFNKINFEIFTQKKVSAKQWLEDRNKFIKSIEKKFNSTEYIEDFRKNISVTCFNNAPLDILMWSHYADNHKGFMLEFKYKKIINDYRNLPLPVLYSNEYPILIVPWNLKDLNKNKEILAEFIYKQILVKAKVWTYENEFRLTTTGNLFKKYNSNMLSSVILGSRIEEKDEMAILEAVLAYNNTNKTNVKIYKTSLVDDKFELSVESHPRLSK